MPTQVYNEAKYQSMLGNLHLNTDDIRAILVMTGSTVDTENDGVATLANFTAVDEFDGAGYVSGDQNLANKTVTKDDVNDLAKFDADDRAYGNLGAGTRQILGVLIIKWNVTLLGSIPICFLEYATAKTADGSAFTAQFNANGIMRHS